MADPMTDAQAPDAMAQHRAWMFPRLAPAHVQRIATIGKRRKVKAGDMLFEVGDRNTAFFVVLVRS